MQTFLGMFLLASATVLAPAHAAAPVPVVTASSTTAVPFYSQFTDISSASWQKVGCGIASLAMVIDYYKPAVSLDTLLKKALALGAYQSSAGWTYAGLIATSKQYGFEGTAYDLGGSDMQTAYGKLSAALAGGPVIASVHYKFNPKNPIPHLVVVDAIKDGLVYYNDPAAKAGGKTIPVADFEKAWKKRYIVIRPAVSNALAIK